MAIGTGIALAAATVAGAAVSANAADNAADQQSDAAAAGIAEQQRQFNEIKELLSPYVDAGNTSLQGQMDLLGIGGNQAQREAIQGLENSSQMKALTQQGENALLQNASALGEVRGGNAKAATAQFRPQMLNQLIDQQYTRLGGLTTLGQNAAAGQGNLGMQSGQNITELLQQQGAAQAGNALAQGQAIQSGIGGISGALGYGQAVNPNNSLINMPVGYNTGVL